MNRLGQRWIAILMVLGLGLTLLSHITTYGEATPMLGLGSDSNSFVYVDGDPINNTDPTGLTRKGLPRNPLELLPLESGGGPRFGGPSSGGRSPFTNKFGPAGPQCPPDLAKTLDRVQKGERYPHRRDGTVFENREALLPHQPHGYYREWVHPTPGVKGPGPQRLVTGAGGDHYYTPDHYKTFISVP